MNYRACFGPLGGGLTRSFEIQALECHRFLNVKGLFS